MGGAVGSKILLPVDSTPRTLEIARQAGAKLVGPDPKEVTLLLIVELPPELLEHGGGTRSEEEHQIEQRMEKARHDWLQERQREAEPEVFAPARRALLESAGADHHLVVTSRIAGGRPEDKAAKTILDEIEQGGYDVLIIGHREETEHDLTALGHLDEEILAESPDCDVWVMD
jgi:nucleotide-binding universal stress UspA family protein